MRRVALALTCLLVAASIAGVVAGQGQERVTRGSPDLSVHVEDNELGVGESTVELQIVNRGDMATGSGPDERVTTARGVTVSASGGGPLSVESDTIAPGAISTQSSATVPVRVSVPADVDPGNYELDVELEYTYVDTIAPKSGVVSERMRTDSFEVDLRVPEGPRFAVTDADTDAQVGGEGSLFVTVRNEGTEAATDARVAVRSTSGGAVVGSTGNGGAENQAAENQAPAQAVAGTLEPGESETLEYDTAVTSPGGYTAEATVAYEDDDGLTRESRALAFGVDPGDEQRFSVDGVETTLSVGATGRMTGTVTNEGPEAVEDAVLVATTGSDRIQLGEGEYALPELEPGESVDFEFDAEVSGQADPGARQLEFTVEYTSGGTAVTSDRQTSRVEVTPREPVFATDAADSIEAGGSTTLAVEVTNNREEALTDITANLYADSPLSTGTDESFVDELGPGETTTVEFELSASGGAMPNTYPVELDFQYTDARGDERISEVYQEPIEVTEASEGDGSLSPLVAVVAIVAVGAAAAILGRRRR